MKNKTKYFLTGTVAAVILAIAAGTFYSNYFLNRALKKIDKVQGELNHTIEALNYSKNKIDTMRNELSAYKLFIKDIHGRVEIMDLENRKNQGRFLQKKDSIRNRLDLLYKQYGISNGEIKITEL